MKYVLDSNIALKWALVEPDSQKAKRLRDDFQKAVHELLSPMRVGVYDCLYVVLAEREACELVTSDQKLVNNLQPHFPFIVPLSSLP